MSGRLIGVVGPSGVGKDTLMRALADANPDLGLVRRVITRAADKGGEDYQPVSEEEFDRMDRNGAFCFSWRAHGLRYGLPARLRDQIVGGEQLLVNLSRGVLTDVAKAFPGFVALNITAEPETLAERLADRGRESPGEITRRLERAAMALPKGIEVVEISNDGPIADTVRAALAALHPVRA